MKKYISVLKRTQLFAGVEDDEITSMLGCLDAKLCSYKKGEYVMRRGEHITSISVLVDGSLLLQKDDYWGNRSIVNIITVPEMFGESYAAPGSIAVMNDVVAEADSTVIMFDVIKLLTVCPSSCKFHSMVVQNLFYAISQKNIQLVQKLGHISKRTTREKLISYLSEQASMHGSAKFCIPFNRQQLADFLSVDRSAMSNELCKMRDEGLIAFEKNNFTLLY